MKDFQTIEAVAAKWGISPRQVRSYCTAGRIAGARFERGAWKIPADAEKPGRKSRRREPGSGLALRSCAVAQTNPWSSIASATLMNPAMLAPAR